MKQTIDAIYQNGIFRPLNRPRIRDGQHVRLEIEETRPDASPTEILDLAAEVYEGLSDTEIEEIEQIALDRRDFFRGKVM